MVAPPWTWRAAALLGLLLCAGAASSSCKKDPPPPKVPAVCAPPPSADVPVIGLSTTDTCPRAKDAKDGRWDAAPVFQVDAAEKLPASMRRLCAYTWSGCSEPDAAALPLDGLADAADDPPIVEALGAAEKGPSAVVTAARARLARAADALSPLPAAAGATPVFVGIPDTSPASPTGADDIAVEAVSHGFDMAWIARWLACPNGSLRACLARVRTDLALGRMGGRGARADLAASIVRLVRAWKARDGRSAPLVIPIAAGWEPLAERALPWRKGPSKDGAPGAGELPAPGAPGDAAQGAPLSPGARAVLGALHYAACHGALVIAAAGNDPGYKEPPSGPMLPAAWEALPAPSAADCKGWFGDDATAKLAAPKVAYAPLVHAVGGVDERDHAIVGSRQKSLPRIVAPASLAAAFPDDPADAGYARLCAPGADVTKAFVCDRTAPRTGTSVAAAVTGAIAAVVWAHHPAWSGHDVMNALHAGGVSLGEKPDVSLSPAGKETVTRIGLCSALAASCKGAPKGACPDKLSCGKLPAFAKGPRPSPFVPLRPGLVSLAIDAAGAAPDAALACPGCVFHTKQLRRSGCELDGVVPGLFFGSSRVAKLAQPGLDVYDAMGRRLGFVEEQGFQPRSWAATEPGNQPVYAAAASCAAAAQVVLRWSACADAACSKVIPMFRELPIVE